MKILFIGKRFYTNRDAFTEKYGRIYQLPYYWSKMGVDVILWLVDYHSKKSQQKLDGHLKIVSTPFKNGALIKKFFWEFLSNNKYGFVVASGDCYIGLLGYILAKLKKSKIVFDVYDKYDEFGAYFNFFGFNSYRFLLKNSDLCLFASRPLQQSLLSVVKDSHVALNGIDENLFKPRDKADSRKTLGLDEGKTYIGYFGTLDIDRGIDDLVAAHRILLDSGVDCDLLVAGNTRPGLKLDHPKISYLGNLPYASVPTAIASCDVLSLPYRRSSYLDMASSCKIAEYMAMKVPIVATRTPNLLSNFGAQAQMLEPYLSEPSDPKSLARVIKKQIVDRFAVNKPDDIYWGKIAGFGLSVLERIHNK